MRLSILLLIVLSLAACVPWRASAPGPAVVQNVITPQALPTAVKPIYTVQRGDLNVQIELNGNIAAVKDEALFFRADGRVRRVYVKEGDQVQKGQVLAELEQAVNLQSQQEMDALDVKRAELRMEIAFLDLAAFQDQPLTERQKKYDLPVKEKQYQLAQIDLDAVKQRVVDLSKAVEDVQIVAQMDGQIFSLSIKEGDSIKAYDRVIEVADPARLDIRIYPDSAIFQDLREGMPVNYERRNAPGKVYSGKISRLPRPDSTDRKAQDTATHIAFDPSVELADLTIQEYVTVTIPLEQKTGVLWLPPQAIRVFEGRPFAVVREGDKQRRVDLTLGLKTAERVEILSGLEEGQVVVVP